MARALFTLPPRWQEVLWYRDVEQMNPEEISVITAMTPVQIDTIQPRARRQLTSAWARVNAQAARSPQCRWVREHSRAFIKKSLPSRDSERIENHLLGCAECRSILTTSRSMGRQASKLLLGSIAGVGASEALSTYISTNGPILINDDPLPTAVADQFAGVVFTPVAVEPPAADVVDITEPEIVSPDVATEEVVVPSEPIVEPISLIDPAEVVEVATELEAPALVEPVAALITTTSDVTPEIALDVEDVAPLVREEDEDDEPGRGLWWWLLPLLILCAAVMGMLWLASGAGGTTKGTPVAQQTPSQSVSVEDPASQIPTDEPTSVEVTPSETASETARPTPSPTQTLTASTPTPSPSTSTRAPTTSAPPPATGRAVSIGSIDNAGGLVFPVIRGTGEPGDTITLTFGGGGPSLSVTADARGAWMASGPYSGLTAGNHSVTAKGRKNPATSTAHFELKKPPGMSVSSTASGVHLSVTGGYGNKTVQILDGNTVIRTATLSGAGATSQQLSLSRGEHRISIRYADGGRYGLSSTIVVRVS
jgi:hypothetical protein